jgi:YVTN family beta-propeller protein
MIGIARIVLSAGITAFVPVAFAQPFVYLGNSTDSAVRVLDVSSRRIVATTVVGANPCRFALHPDGTKMFIGTDGPLGIVAMNTESNSLLSGSFGPPPTAVVPNFDGTRLYATIGSEVQIIDAASGTVTAHIRVGINVGSLAIDPSETRVYVATVEPGLNLIAVIDLSIQAVMTSVPVGGAPRDVAMLPDGSRVFVACGNNSLNVIDTASNLSTGTVPIADPAKLSLSPTGARLYATTSDGHLVIVDTSSNSVVATPSVGASPRGVSVAPDGSVVCVVNQSGHSVSLVDPVTNTASAEIPVGFAPCSIGEFVLVGRAPPCSTGNVGLGNGTVTNTLFVNDSSGTSDRTVDVDLGASIVVSLNAAPNGPAEASYALWIWRGAPRNATWITPGTATLGCSVNPTPLEPFAVPQPIRALRAGLPAVFSAGILGLPSPASAPWHVTNRGFGSPTTLTLQGVIQDDGSANPFGFSVTNAIVVRIQ